MKEEHRRERDLVLSQNEFAYILDETKGHVVVYVGPHKTSLANTDQPVYFDETARRFRSCSLETSITSFPFAEEGWYVELENPGPADDSAHPKPGPNSVPKLTYGRKVSIAGPATFPLWPGQVARVIQGHHLRSNQYLLVRVYNEDAARENWSQAVIKTKDESLLSEQDLTIGKEFIIRGTEVAFVIPPTGVEVVQDAQDRYIREAVTLERLEYCILLDEDGNKRYVQGPQVVFPRPSEVFVEEQGRRKFRAVELHELSGIYLKVIAPYSDEKGVAHEVGEELFITGQEQKIYFPRPEHAVIRYGPHQIHHAIAIPSGEARYVLDRESGRIALVQGPRMYLPDPRREVVVRRVLEPEQVALWFPGSSEAMAHNVALRERPEKGRKAPAVPNPEPSSEVIKGEGFERGRSYSPPRTLVLDDRYEGVVNIDVWTGYAVQVVDRDGRREVVVGPTSRLLEYTETLERLTLSRGLPKNDQSPLETVYLRVLNNQVTDRLSAETSDLVKVELSLSYRVSFTGDPSHWFSVENYVKFLTEHLRSHLRSEIKKATVEDLFSDAVTRVQDAVLGPADAEGQRPGKTFEQNGMRVYDVDVLEFSVGEDKVAKLLLEAQQSAVEQTVALSQHRRELAVTREREELTRSIDTVKAETLALKASLALADLERGANLELARLEAKASATRRDCDLELERQETLNALTASALQRARLAGEQELELAHQRQQQEIEKLRAEVAGVVEKAQAVSPDLVAALQAFGDRHLAEKMASSMAPLAILGGESVADVLARLLKNTPLEQVVRALPSGTGAA